MSYFRCFCQDISVHKIQGLTFKAETQSGDIEAKAVYADHSDFLSRSGEIRLGSCHRDCSIKIEEKGNVHVGKLTVLSPSILHQF